MSVVPHDLLLELHHAAVSCELYRARNALLAGVDRSLVASIPTGPDPSSQLLNDLDFLNRVQPVDGPGPLPTWLANALALAGAGKEAGALRRAASRVARTSTALVPMTALFDGPDGEIEKEPLGQPVDQRDTFEEIWHRAESSRPGLASARAAVLYVLAMARKPLAAGEIERLSGATARQVSEILDEWQSALCCRHNQVEGHTYFPRSAAFREFLYWQDDVQAAGVDLSGTQLGAGDAFGVLFGDE